MDSVTNMDFTICEIGGEPYIWKYAQTAQSCRSECIYHTTEECSPLCSIFIKQYLWNQYNLRISWENNNSWEHLPHST